MRSPKTLIELLRPAAEAVILAMACLSPWAIGAVDAWAQLILDVGLGLLVVLGLASGRRADWARRLFCVPSLALAGLALLGALVRLGRSVPRRPGSRSRAL